MWLRVEGWYRGLGLRVGIEGYYRVKGWYRGLGLGLVSRVRVEGWCRG